ncbi:DUF4351 domain-containing protein [Leptolyngbya sp. AN10]|uniref:DUF4351 domain-containing protein n=1 Tax=Leptolyngbya sp. AN10 TaxID=3423365 RepID=UPI003D31053D
MALGLCDRTFRFGDPTPRPRLSSLPLPVLEDLSEDLLDFTTLADLEAWLEERAIVEQD